MPIDSLSDTLSASGVLLDTQFVGGNACGVVDSLGRAIESVLDVHVWDGLNFVESSFGETLYSFDSVGTTDAVADEVIVCIRNKKLSIPDSLASSTLTVSQTSGSPATKDVLSSVGAIGISRLFPRLDSDDIWTDPIGGISVRKPNLSGFYRVSLPTNSDLEACIRALRRHGNIDWAEPNYTGMGGAVPNDTLYCTLQYPVCPSLSSHIDLDVERVWDEQVGRKGVRVAVIDAGVSYEHPDLGGGFGSGFHVEGGHDYRQNDNDPDDTDQTRSHGTMVAGIIGALTDNVTSIAGIAGGWGSEGSEGVDLYALRVLDDEQDVATTADVAQALAEAGDNSSGFGVDVANVSLHNFNGSQTLRGGVLSAYADGVTVVSIKGNTMPAGVNGFEYPGDYDPLRMMSVGSVDETGQRATTSNFGGNIDLVAPGENVWSLRWWDPNDDDVRQNSGTSFAAPHVSGAAALLVSEAEDQGITLWPEDVQWLINYSATDEGPAGYDVEYGHGILNIGKAFDFLQAPWALSHGTAASGSGNVTLVDPRLFLGEGPLQGAYVTKKHDVRKEVTYSETYIEQPFVWGRGVGATTGWSQADPNFQLGWCRVVSGSETESSCTLQTFVFEVFDFAGNFVGWYPCKPEDVVWGYSVLGKLATYVGIDGGNLESHTEPKLKISPNPFNPEILVSLEHGGSAAPTVQVFDVSGRLVARLLPQVQNAPGGHAEYRWYGDDESGRQVRSGVYFLRAIVGKDDIVARATLVR